MTTVSFVDIAEAQVTSVETAGSTNEECLRLAREGRTEPLWYRAGSQTSGRGRLGRGWSSPRGNLYASLLLHAPAESRCLAQLSHVAAVALVDALTRVIGPDPRLRIKWPNDLLYDGAKLAGILVEATTCKTGGTSCVIGWGVNLTSHPGNLPYAAADLSSASGRSVSANTVFEALRAAMQRALSLWDRGRGYSYIREAWLASAVPIGTAMVVMAGPGKIHGTFREIDCEGRLVIEGPVGVATIEAGDVFLDDRSAAAAG